MWATPGDADADRRHCQQRRQGEQHQHPARVTARADDALQYGDEVPM
ncbi:hypothetical protein [Streptomyces atratus]|nr:hypothetical protein [Streptomyces atratus]